MFLESFHSLSQYISFSAHPLALLQHFKKLFAKFLSKHPALLLKMEST